MAKTYLIDIFKIYKSIWNEKKKSPSLPQDYPKVIEGINTQFKTKFERYTLIDKLDRFYTKHKEDFSPAFKKLNLLDYPPTINQYLQTRTVKNSPRLMKLLPKISKYIVDKKLVSKYSLVLNYKNPNKRVAIATEINVAHLLRMVKDPSVAVREIVAQRILVKHLPAMLETEKETSVIDQIVSRIDAKYLPKVKSKSYDVRLTLARRLSPEHLSQFAHVRDSELKITVSRRIEPQYLKGMLEKTYDANVATTIGSRLTPEEIEEYLSKGTPSKKVRRALTSFLSLEALRRLPKDVIYEEVTGERVKVLPVIKSAKDVPVAKLKEALVTGFKSMRINKNTPALPGLDYLFTQRGLGDTLVFRESWLDTSNNYDSALLKKVIGGPVYHHNESDASVLFKQAKESDPKFIQKLAKGLRLSRIMTSAILDVLYPDVDKIDLYRGTGSKEVDAQVGEIVLGLHNSVSSWTSVAATAKGFAKLHRGVALKASVSKKDILTSNLFWSLHEEEREWTVISKSARPVEVIYRGDV